MLMNSTGGIYMKRYLTILIIAVMAAAASACSGPDHDGGSGTQSGSGSAGDDIRAGVERTVGEKSFAEADTETRGRIVEEYLHEAAEKGTTDQKGNKIVAESIERDEESGLCLYVDTDGGLNIVRYGQDDSYTTGDTQFTDDYPGTGVTDARGILLYGLDAPGSRSAQDQEAAAERLRQQGSDCEIDTSVTVAEYRSNMQGYDYIIIRTHGSMFSYSYGVRNSSSDRVPVLCTLEEITSSNLTEYAEDIREQRIAKVTVITDEETNATRQQYWILPSFFTEYYGGGGLEGAYVHIGSCKGFGCMQDGDGSIDFALADALISCGADAVTGFYNTVFTYYGSDMIATIMSHMLAGETLGEAVLAAESAHGDTDEVYAQNRGWLDQSSPYYKSTREKLDKGAAWLVICGDADKRFARTEPEVPEEPEEPEVPEEPAATGSYEVVGEWIDLAKREELGDQLLWDDKIVFSYDGSGYIAQSGGAIEFLYTFDENGVVYIETFNGNIYQGKISEDNTTLRVLYQDEFNDYEVDYTYQR